MSKDVFDQIELLPGNPLEGKKLCVLGSSVAFGAASEEKAVGEYLAARLGMSLIKEAVSGTTLATVKPESYIERMLRLDPNADHDLFICQLSTNDATKGIALGEICATKDPEDFDTKTVTGAIEYIIRYARTTWNCPILFFTGSRYESENYKAMVDQLKRLAEKWEIGILDLWTDDAFNAISEEDRAYYMADPIHPKRPGYALWWGPEMEKQLLAWIEQ